MMPLCMFTLVPPRLRITSCTLAEDRVTVTWEVLAGRPSSLSLVHGPDADKRSSRVLLSNIPPDPATVSVVGQFRLDRDNHFDILAYEDGSVEPTGGADERVTVPALRGHYCTEGGRDSNANVMR